MILWLISKLAAVPDKTVLCLSIIVYAVVIICALVSLRDRLYVWHMRRNGR